MQRRPVLFVLFILLLAVPLTAQSPPRCSADAVKRDIQDTLIGGVEISSLRVTWATDSEGPDLDHYELRSRDGAGKGERLQIIMPRYACPQKELHEVIIEYDPTVEYFVEIHLVDRTFTGVPVPIF